MTSTATASAGFIGSGRATHDSVQRLMDERGVGMTRKLSQKVNADMVSRAEVILTMTSDHARTLVARFPKAITNVYTLRHFGKIVTPRAQGTSISDWLDELNRTNQRAYIGDDDALDIADPIGHNFDVFTNLAVELETTISWIMDCAFPNPPA